MRIVHIKTTHKQLNPKGLIEEYSDGSRIFIFYRTVDYFYDSEAYAQDYIDSLDTFPKSWRNNYPFQTTSKYESLESI